MPAHPTTQHIKLDSRKTEPAKILLEPPPHRRPYPMATHIEMWPIEKLADPVK